MVSKLKITRVLERPDPQSWAEDELMTLAEAALLFWPSGPLSEETLRTAVRDGRLPVSEIARKLFTTKRALTALHVCTTRPTEPRTAREEEAPSRSPPPFASTAQTARTTARV